MPSSRALIVERDQEFAGRLERCLDSLGFAVASVQNRREALECLKGGEVGIVIIAVERPQKAGFKVFTDVKRLLRNVPIVLTTSTLPMAELLLHQKLRLHADAYLDKRELTDRALLDKLNGLLGLGFDSTELSRMARASRPGPGRRTRSRRPPLSSGEVIDDPVFGADDLGLDERDQDRLDAIDPTLTDLLSDLDGGRRAPDSDEDDIACDPLEEQDDPEASDEAIAALQEEVDRLRRELEHAQRSASSSPFSTDYVDLSNQVDAQRRKNARLQRDLDTRGRQVETLRGKLLQVAGRLLDAERQRDHTLDRLQRVERRIAPLESDLSAARQLRDDLTRRLEEEQRARSSLEREYASTVEGLESRLAEEKKRLIEARQQHRTESSAMQQRHRTELEETVEHERKRAEEQRELNRQEYETAALARTESARRELAAVLREQNERWQQKLDELSEQHARESAARDETYRKEVETLQVSMEQALSRKQREMEKAFAEAAAEGESQQRQVFDYERKISQLQAEHQGALESKDRDHRERIETLRREHADELEARAVEHRRHVDQLTAAHQAALAEAERGQREAIEQALDDARQDYVRDAAERLSEFEEAEARHRRAMAEAEERYEEQLALFRKLNEEHLEQLKSRHERELEILRNEHRTALADVESRAISERESAAAERQAEWQAEIDAMRHEQARTLAAEREEMRVLIDALETVKGVDRSEDPAEPALELDGTSSEQHSRLLRQIAEEMDRIGGPSPDTADANEDVEPTVDSSETESKSTEFRLD